MEELIKALTILHRFLKKPNNKYPTACEHDVLYVGEIDYTKMSAKDVQELAKLGFYPGSDEDHADFEDFELITEEKWKRLVDSGVLAGCFHSYRYGSF
ncbi:MAG: hypothetical protein J6X18_08765 [Bacteroidales bacterium]|nr:hypothetical protein [Bacteroidales bacterium]